MNLYKLNGYNEVTGQYIDPNTSLPALLPAPAFIVSTNSPGANYSDFSAPENWAPYASNLLGIIQGFRDFLALRYEIYSRIEVIAGADYLNWDLLSTAQKATALIYAPTRIINARGINFFVVQCGGVDIANTNVDNYLNWSEGARIKRYNAWSNYGYTYLGKTQGLSAEDLARHDFLDTKYMVRGVLFTSEDGIDGLGDWVLGLNGYAATGLKPLIIAGTYNLPPGVDVNVFCDTLIGILQDGLY